MVAVGLVATIAAALLSTDKPIGAVELSWERRAPLPDSKPTPIPGGGEMRLSDAGIRASEANASGYRLYRVAAVLDIDAGSAVGQGRVRCTTRSRALVAQTPGSRAAYPRSSSEDDVTKQDVAEQVQVEFNSHGTELASVDLGDAFDRFSSERGVIVSWGAYREGAQVWQWGLPPGRPAETLKLGFASIWRGTAAPAAQISCTLETSAGTATTRTAGALVESGRAGS